VNPLLALIFDFLKRYLFRAFAIFALTYAVLLYVGRRELRQSDGRSRLGIAGLFALTLLLAILGHWLQFKIFQIPLPFERTSIFVVPLLTASIAAAVAVRPFNSLTRAVRGFGIGILLVAGLYFVGELRDSYFREWKECAEIKAAYPVVLDLCRRNAVREIASDINLTRSFNLYRELYKSNEIDELPMLDQMPPGKPIYVLLESRNEEFIRNEGLQPVWRGSISDLVIYVKPGLLTAAKP
jgi:hypothetical protein